MGHVSQKRLQRPTFQPITHHHLATSSRRVLFSSNQRPDVSYANQSRWATRLLPVYKLISILSENCAFDSVTVNLWSCSDFLCGKKLIRDKSLIFLPRNVSLQLYVSWFSTCYYSYCMLADCFNKLLQELAGNGLNCMLQIPRESSNWTMIHRRNRAIGLLAVVLLASVLNVQSKDDDDKSKKDSVGTVIGIDLGTTYSWSVLIVVKLPSLYNESTTASYFIINILFYHRHCFNEPDITDWCWLVLMCNTKVLLQIIYYLFIINFCAVFPSVLWYYCVGDRTNILSSPDISGRLCSVSKRLAKQKFCA